jgi:hypothetical protein
MRVLALSHLLSSRVLGIVARATRPAFASKRAKKEMSLDPDRRGASIDSDGKEISDLPSSTVSLREERTGQSQMW